MTSKERFDLTVNHKQPDRLVVDLGSTSVNGNSCKNRLKTFGNITDLKVKPVRVIEPYQMLGEVDQELIASHGYRRLWEHGAKNNIFWNLQPRTLEGTDNFFGDKKVPCS